MKVAFAYLSRHSFDEALTRMRVGIKAYNAHHRVPESETSGYNETTTHAFLHLIAATMRAYALTHPAADADAFCDTHPQLMTRHPCASSIRPSDECIPEAKARFVEPDLAPLPTILPRD